MNTDPDYQSKCKAMFEIISNKRENLFKDVEFVSISDYLKYFERQYKCEFYPFPSLFPYRPEIVDKYSKNIYNSFYGQFDPTGNLIFHTIVQFSPTFHGLFIYGNLDDEIDKIAVYVTLHSSDQNNFINFVKDNNEFIYDNTKAVGFKFVR